MQKVKYEGKIYRSVAVACHHLGITQRSVARYTEKGISVEQAIEQILKNKKRNSCTDHLGNEFESIRCMAISYSLPPAVLYTRLNRKWDLERALTTPTGTCPSTKHRWTEDHLGNEFESKRAMAKFYNIPYRTLYTRLYYKWSLEKALTTPNGKPRGKYASKVQGQKI